MKVIIERPGRIGTIVNIEQRDGGVVHLGEEIRSRIADHRVEAKPAPVPVPEEALCDVLVSMFDAAQFREWLSLHGYADALARLPAAPASLRLLCFEFVVLLRRTGGLTADLFDDLVEEFPGRWHDITRVRQVVLEGPDNQVPVGITSGSPASSSGRGVR